MTAPPSVPFFATFARLPGIWPPLFFVVLSGMAEGFGLALFVPLLEIMTSGSDAGLGRPFSLIGDAYRGLGLPVTLLSMLGAIAVLILGSLVLGYVQRWLVIRVRHRYARGQREAFTEALFRSSWGHISGLSHGETINQFVVECNRAAVSLQNQLLCVASVIQIAIYFILSSVLSWRLMLVTVAFGVVVVAAARPLQRRARILGNATSVANRNLSFYGVDFLKGAKLIKATSAEEAVVARLRKHIGVLFDVGFGSEINGARIYLLVQAIPVLLLVVIIALAHDVLDIEPSATLVFLLILARVAPRMGQSQNHYQAYNVASPAIGLVDEMIEDCRAGSEESGGGDVAFERLERGISLEDVGFAYPGGDGATVAGVSLDIERNRMVALVGSSGSGKSTLIDLVCALRRPNSGRIAIDGVDLARIDPASWHRRIGYVAQDTVVFNDTLRNNLLFAHPEAGEERIRRVLELVHLNDTVAGMPEGLDTVLGEGGIRLSGGQKQRLALARALVGEPQILLLDEATSALDTESEFRIQKAIESIAHTLTIVVVAHRLSTVRKADVIHVMEHGRIVETGSYADLLARHGRFAELHDAQFS